MSEEKEKPKSNKEFCPLCDTETTSISFQEDDLFIASYCFRCYAKAPNLVIPRRDQLRKMIENQKQKEEKENAGAN